MTHCAYCGRGHEREGKAYCSAWCACRGAAHSASASRQRNAALRAERERPQERNRITKLYRQLAFGDVDAAVRAIFEPAGRKRRRRLGLLRDPEGK